VVGRSRSEGTPGRVIPRGYHPALADHLRSLTSNGSARAKNRANARKVNTMPQATKTEINRPTEWREWSVSEAHLWLRAQLGLPTQRGRSSTLGLLSDLLRVWDAPRPEFWPTLIWDRHRRQISAQMDEEVLAELPAILREAQGTPEYQQLWWAWRTLGGSV
jgi:hypothetical protein